MELFFNKKREKMNLEEILINGEISSLTETQRIEYVGALCKSLGLNPLLRPFQFIRFDGKIQLYATRTCAEQLREVKKLSIPRVDVKKEGDYIFCEVTIIDASGRQDTETACLWLKQVKKAWNEASRKMEIVRQNGQPVIEDLAGADYANAHMKVVTKAKRRATLAFAGLGILDESEIDTLEGAKVSKDALMTAFHSTSQENHALEEKESKTKNYLYDVAKLPENKQQIALQLALSAGGEQNDNGIIVCKQEIKKLKNALIQEVEES